MADKFLDKAYALSGAEETRDLYDQWSASYEAEVGEHGYATPARVADALKQIVTDHDTPILDYGCGTGLSGLALKLDGFNVIDGIDVSPQMLAQAREKALYRNLTLFNPNEPPPVEAGAYGCITAIGVIGVGAAPLSTFDTIMALLAKGGIFALSYNDHALSHPEYEAKIAEYTDTGRAHLRFSEHGPHLPGVGLHSTIYVLEKA